MTAPNNRMRGVWEDDRNLAGIAYLFIIKTIVLNDTNVFIVVESLSVAAEWFAVCRLSIRKGCLYHYTRKMNCVVDKTKSACLLLFSCAKIWLASTASDQVH